MLNYKRVNAYIANWNISICLMGKLTISAGPWLQELCENYQRVCGYAIAPLNIVESDGNMCLYLRILRVHTCTHYRSRAWLNHILWDIAILL